MPTKPKDHQTCLAEVHTVGHQMQQRGLDSTKTLEGQPQLFHRSIDVFKVQGRQSPLGMLLSQRDRVVVSPVATRRKSLNLWDRGGKLRLGYWNRNWGVHRRLRLWGLSVEI